METNKKITWLLILQGWAMLWVVIGHAGPANHIEEFPHFAQILWNFAYSFHMALFIFISGFLFFSNKNKYAEMEILAYDERKTNKVWDPLCGVDPIRNGH